MMLVIAPAPAEESVRQAILHKIDQLKRHRQLQPVRIDPATISLARLQLRRLFRAAVMAE